MKLLVGIMKLLVGIMKLLVGSGDNEAFGGGQPKIYTLDLGLTKKTCSLKISYFQ